MTTLRPSMRCPPDPGKSSWCGLVACTARTCAPRRLLLLVADLVFGVGTHPLRALGTADLWWGKGRIPDQTIHMAIMPHRLHLDRGPLVLLRVLLLPARRCVLEMEQLLGGRLKLESMLHVVHTGVSLHARDSARALDVRRGSISLKVGNVV